MRDQILAECLERLLGPSGRSKEHARLIHIHEEANVFVPAAAARLIHADTGTTCE